MKKQTRYPGFRSLRSLHPGLNSAAGYAGSLNGLFPRYAIEATLNLETTHDSKTFGLKTGGTIELSNTP